MSIEPITVDSLTVAPGFGQTFAEWTLTDPNANGLPYLQLDTVELWAATANDREHESFAKVAEGRESAIHYEDDGAQRWYWARAKDKSARYSEWYPASATGGVAGAETALIASPGYMKLSSDLAIEWGYDYTDANGDVAVEYQFLNSPYFPFSLQCTISRDVATDEAFVVSIKDIVISSTNTHRLEVRRIADGGVVEPAPADVTVQWLAIGFRS